MHPAASDRRYVNGGPSVTGVDGAHELRAAQTSPLVVAMPLKRLDELRILAIAKRFGVEAEIHVRSADMGHFGILQQKPRDGAADHGELSVKAAQNLDNLERHRSDRFCGRSS